MLILGMVNMILNIIIPFLCFAGLAVWNTLVMTNNTEAFKGKLQQQAAALQGKFGETKSSLSDRMSNMSKDTASAAPPTASAAKKRFCAKCGAPCNGQAKFCPKCGAAISR